MKVAFECAISYVLFNLHPAFSGCHPGKVAYPAVSAAIQLRVRVRVREYNEEEVRLGFVSASIRPRSPTSRRPFVSL